MARLMSQIKGGYYAAAPAAVAAVLERLRPPSSGECVILDPCAGEGHALLQLAQGLQCGALRHRAVRRSCGPGAGIVARGPIAGSGRLPAVCDQLPLVLILLVQPSLRLRHGRRRQGGKRSSSSVPPICWPTTACWPWCARMTLPTATRPASSLKSTSTQISAMPFPEEVRKYNETVILGCKRKQSRVVNSPRLPLRLAGAADGRTTSSIGCLPACVPGFSARRSPRTPNWHDWSPRARSVPYRTARRSCRLSPQAAVEPWQRASCHALGVRSYRRTDLPAQ